MTKSNRFLLTGAAVAGLLAGTSASIQASNLIPGGKASASAQGAVVAPLDPPLTRRIGTLHRRGALSPAAAAFVGVAVPTAGGGQEPG